MVLRWRFPSLPTKKMAKPNLVIGLVFLVDRGLWGGRGGPWGYR